jgi:hypothetical protein
MAVLQLNKHGGKILSNGSHLFSIRMHKNPEYFAFDYDKNKMHKNTHTTKLNTLRASSKDIHLRSFKRYSFKDI